MYAQVEKSKENSFPTNRQESRAVANNVGQKKSNGKQGFGFVDNRSSFLLQRKFKDKANSLFSAQTVQRMKSSKKNPNLTLNIGEIEAANAPRELAVRSLGQNSWTGPTADHPNAFWNFYNHHQVIDNAPPNAPQGTQLVEEIEITLNYYGGPIEQNQYALPIIVPNNGNFTDEHHITQTDIIRRLARKNVNQVYRSVTDNVVRGGYTLSYTLAYSDDDTAVGIVAVKTPQNVAARGHNTLAAEGMQQYSGMHHVTNIPPRVG